MPSVFLLIAWLQLLASIASFRIKNGQYQSFYPKRFVRHVLINDAPCSPTKSSFEHRSLNINIEEPIIENDISDENLLKIVNLEATDMECNYLTWKCLGYQFNSSNQEFYLTDRAFPKWARKYPVKNGLGPDLIGVTRNYADQAIDRSVRDASMDLMRTIPKSYKGGVRSLSGFKGFKLNELTPNKTRRAQMVNWLIYYRDCLFGKSIEQLRSERALLDSEKGSDVSPSEVMFQRGRLDTGE